MSLEQNKEYQKLISERYDLLDQKNSLDENIFKTNLEILDLRIDEQKKINLSNEAILINEVRNITNNLSLIHI